MSSCKVHTAHFAQLLSPYQHSAFCSICGLLADEVFPVLFFYQLTGTQETNGVKNIWYASDLSQRQKHWNT